MTYFKVGDRVRVQSTHFPEQNGLTGKIIDLNHAGRLKVRVLYDGQPDHPYFSKYNLYAEMDLIHDDNYLMEDHEFTLDEILQSKELIEGIEHDRRRNQ